MSTITIHETYAKRSDAEERRLAILNAYSQRKFGTIVSVSEERDDRLKPTGKWLVRGKRFMKEI